MELPRGHEEIGSARAGTEYGHVPGHRYHDVQVVISRRGSAIRCAVREEWGSCQGRLLQEGCNEVVGRGPTIREACRDAQLRAEKADVRKDYLTRAISMAEDQAEESVMD